MTLPVALALTKLSRVEPTMAGGGSGVQRALARAAPPPEAPGGAVWAGQLTPEQAALLLALGCQRASALPMAPGM